MNPPCDREIFQKGQPLAALDGPANAVERWVREVAKKADARIDWHSSGGIAHVLHLGDAASRERAVAAIEELKDKLTGTVLIIYPVGAPGLYRAGVTEAPPGATGGFMGDDGNTVYMI